MFGKSSKKYFGLRGNGLHRAVGVIGGTGFLLFGYDQGVMGGLLTLDSFLNNFPKLNDETIQGTAISIYEIGCMMGALSVTAWGDRYGRRMMIFIGSIIMTIGAILQASAFSLAQLIVGRIVTGIGNGMITATVPTYQSECAKPEARGKLVMIAGALITGGICLSYWIDFALYFAKGEVQWRFPVAFQIIFAVILIFTVLELPESPRWLIKQNRLQEACEVFSCFEDTAVDDPVINAHVNEIYQSIEEDDKGKGNFLQIFTFGKEKHFHRAMLAIANQAAQQLTGINLITYYAAKIYQQNIGLSPLKSRILAACNGTEYFLASWIAFYTIERIGRRKLMLFCAAGQSGTMAILTATVWSAREQNNGGAGIAAAVFLFVFNTFFAIGWLGMTWLYPAEIIALETRAAGTGLSTASNWIFNFMVVMITPVSFANIDYYTYMVFAIINALIFFAVWIFYPETAGRSLEDINHIFENSNPRTPWDVVKIANNLPKTDYNQRPTTTDFEKTIATHQENVNNDSTETSSSGNEKQL